MPNTTPKRRREGETERGGGRRRDSNGWKRRSERERERDRRREKEATRRGRRGKIQKEKLGRKCGMVEEERKEAVLRRPYAKRRHLLFCNEPRHGNKKAKGSRERMLITDNYKPNKYGIYDSPPIS